MNRNGNTETTCATIEDEKKKHLHNWVAVSERTEKKCWWEWQAYSRILDSPFECDCSPCDICSEWNEKEKNGKKRTKRRKETPWRHRPETERFQMRRKRENREHERGITSGWTPTMPARTTNVLLYKAANLLFRNLSMCDTVRWCDTTQNSVASRNADSPAIVIF